MALLTSISCATVSKPWTFCFFWSDVDLSIASACCVTESFCYVKFRISTRSTRIAARNRLVTPWYAHNGDRAHEIVHSQTQTPRAIVDTKNLSYAVGYGCSGNSHIRPIRYV